MDIDWNEVIPGKTVLVWKDDEYPIIGIFGDSVWAKTPRFADPQNFHKSDFKNCHIKGQWQEITEECELRADNRIGKLHWLRLCYKNNYISFDECHGEHPKFKIEGMRIFTCN